jgi:ribose transport system ATP-binding protein
MTTPTRRNDMDAALAVRRLAKAYAGVPVLRGITFDVAPGTLTVLAGENGAGKSTLMKVVMGQVHADAGSVEVCGATLERADPREARRLGVGIVPQELAPYPDLNVYENFFVGRERRRLGMLDRRAMAREARELLATFGVDLDVTRPLRDLPVALTQIVEVAKATSQGARVLLLDEPTSSISDRETERLYEVVRSLKRQGVAMVYTTHRMAEIEELADRVVVLRDGELVLDAAAHETDEGAIVEAMVGRSLAQGIAPPAPAQQEVRLAVRGLRHLRHGPAVDLEVRRGEVLGIGGLVGAGRTEVLETIFGLRRACTGDVRVDGQAVRRDDPAAAIRAGIALVPEDRKGAGLVLQRSVLDNGSLPHLAAFTRGGVLDGRRRRQVVGDACEAVRLRSRGVDQEVGTLSGGNQQKVVLSRWLSDRTRVLLLDEPTRGVDVGAREDVYRIIRDLAARGMAVVLVSSDMPELIALSHRVAVMHDHALAGELDRTALAAPDAQERIFRLASGQDRTLEEDVA